MRSLDLLPLENRSFASPTHLEIRCSIDAWGTPAPADIRLSGREQFAHEVDLNMVEDDQNIPTGLASCAATPEGLAFPSGITSTLRSKMEDRLCRDPNTDVVLP